MIVGKYRTFLGGSESLWDFVGGVVGKNWLWNSCGLQWVILSYCGISLGDREDFHGCLWIVVRFFSVVLGG